MRVVILAGGMGSRLQEETSVRPKPMVEIGGRPMLWHIMKHLRRARLHRSSSSRSATRARSIKRLLPRLSPRSTGNLTIESADGAAHACTTRLRRTGLVHLRRHRPRDRRPAAALKRRLETASATSTFMLTYGDGVANVDIARAASRSTGAHGQLATVTAVRPPARFGGLGSTATASSSSRRSRRSAKAGSTAASSCSSPACSTTSPATSRSRARRRSSGSRADGQLAGVPARGLLAADGHAARRASCSRRCGRRARRPGRCWA